MCGTNMIVRRRALEDVGGLDESNVTEDFLTSLFLHRKGWQSVYVPKILCEGLAPEDLRSYQSQQLRWARGCLDLLLRHRPWRSDGLTLAQRIQYLFSASHYLCGLVLLIEITIPLVALFGGFVPLESGAAAVTGTWLLFVTTMLVLVGKAGRGALSFSGLSFLLGSFPIHVRALVAALGNRKGRFAVTPKRRTGAAAWPVAVPHLLYCALAGAGISTGIVREGLSPTVLASSAWTLAFVVLFIPFIAAVVPEGPRERNDG